jgi:hypothetical protein
MKKSGFLFVAILGVPAVVWGQSAEPCADVVHLKLQEVEITKSEVVPGGTTVPAPYPGAPSIGPLPAHCRVDGILHRRKGAALMQQCDGRDGVVDGMISDPLGCTFDPDVLACKSGQVDACIAPEKVAAVKKAFAGPKNEYGTQVYPGFLYELHFCVTPGTAVAQDSTGLTPMNPPTFRRNNAPQTGFAV